MKFLISWSLFSRAGRQQEVVYTFVHLTWTYSAPSKVTVNPTVDKISKGFVFMELTF